MMANKISFSIEHTQPFSFSISVHSCESIVYCTCILLSTLFKLIDYASSRSMSIV
jgi:hypothetical protein